MSRRSARRRPDRERRPVEPMGRPFADFDTGALPPELIPDGAALWCSLAGVDRSQLAKGRTSTFVIGLYDVDTIRCLLRPRCTCGWTMEAVTTWEDEYRGQVAQRSMLAHAGQHGDEEPVWRFAPGHWSFYGGAGRGSNEDVTMRAFLEGGPATSADGA